MKYIGVGGLLYYAKVTSGAGDITDVALLVSAAAPTALEKGKATLLFADGTKRTVSTKYDYTTKTIATEELNSDLIAVEKTTPTQVSDAHNCGKLYKYSVDNDGVYTLTEAAKVGATMTIGGVASQSVVSEKMGDFTWYNKNLAGTGTAAGYTLAISSGTSATIGTDPVADDAVIFLFNRTLGDGSDTDAVAGAGTNEAKIITGKDLKSIASNGAALSSKVFTYATSKSNGLTRVAFAVVSTAADNADLDALTIESSANYGYIVSTPYTTKIDGSNYVVYTVWNGSETVKYNCKADNIATGTFNGAAATAGKGMVIGYDVVDSGTIKNVKLINTTIDAVTGGAGSKELQFEKSGGTLYKLDGDTVYLYVDSANSSSDEIGVTGGSVQNATSPASGYYIQNVMYLANGSNEVEIIVVDVNNQLNNREKIDMTSITNSIPGVTITLNDKVMDYATAANNKIAVGDIIKISTGDTSCKYSIDNVLEGTQSNVVLAANSSVTFTASGAGAMTITIATNP